jgi:hypothetical protein
MADWLPLDEDQNKWRAWLDGGESLAPAGYNCFCVAFCRCVKNITGSRSGQVEAEERQTSHLGLDSDNLAILLSFHAATALRRSE